MRNIEFAGYLLVGNPDIATHPQLDILSTPPDGYRVTQNPMRPVNSLLLEGFLQSLDPDMPPPQSGNPHFDGLVGSIIDITRRSISLGASLESVKQFLLTRPWRINCCIPNDAELLFLQTIPDAIGPTPWVIEIEDPTTLFFPDLSNGSSAEADIKALPCRPMVQAMLESDTCKGIITHVKATADSLPRIFESEIIGRKTFHIQMGVDTEKITLPPPRTGRPTNLLFTNSWHQGALNFYYRGGLDVLEAFFALADRHPDLTLTIRSALPKLPEPLLEKIVKHPRIHIIPGFLEESELRALMAKTNLFVIPGAHLHVISVLKSFAHGIPVIGSDAWGFEDYIEHGRTGFRLKGRHGAVSWTDPANGMLREDYSSLLRPVPTVVQGLIDTISNLLENPEIYAQMQYEARIAAETKFSIQHWNTALKNVLDAIYAQLPPVTELPHTPVDVAQLRHFSRLAAENGQWWLVYAAFRHGMEEFPGKMKDLTEILTDLKKAAMVQYQAGNLDAARDAFAMGAGILRTDLDFSINLGNVLMEQQNPQEAIKHFQNALLYNPCEIDALVGMSIVAKQLNDVATAKSCARRLKVLAPDNADIQEYVASLVS